MSTLSGYCEALSGDLYAFSILMNGVYPSGARQLQDRMAQAIAAVRDGALTPPARRGVRDQRVIARQQG